MKNLIPTVVFALILFACETPTTEQSSQKDSEQPEFIILSMMGDTLEVPSPSDRLMDRYDSIKSIFMEDSNNPDNLIWMGRFEAYAGNYEKAFEIYSKGIELFPNDPRFPRHRGHRYISVRWFDEAIADLTAAATLIEGTENQVEPDGMPNARGIPVSTLHGNIYYHLGLAHYLKQNWESAFDAYSKCLETGSKPDNVVSATHWLYMISRRMGQTHEEARFLLDPIEQNMDIIENFAYHKLCLFYKGEISEEELLGGEDSASANDAVLYGLGNWYFYNGDLEQSKAIFDDILSRDSWNSFGYIAAEVDMMAEFR